MSNIYLYLSALRVTYIYIYKCSESDVYLYLSALRVSDIYLYLSALRVTYIYISNCRIFLLNFYIYWCRMFSLIEVGWFHASITPLLYQLWVPCIRPVGFISWRNLDLYIILRGGFRVEVFEHLIPIVPLKFFCGE